MAKAMGLGRGLDVLLKGMTVSSEHPEVMLLKVDEIQPNPRQPRLEFDPEALQDLASSIKEQGVLQPILVRAVQGGAHGYELVAGERRLRASKLAGLETIPALLREVTDEQSLALALIENLQRENLNALEEAKGLEQLLETFSLSQEALAQKVGKSRSAVANSLRLLQLPQAIQDSLFKDGITAGHARALLAITSNDDREALWKRVVDQGLSVRETEEAAAYWRENGLLPEPGAVAVRPKAGRRQRPRPGAELVELGGKLRDRFRVNVKVGGDGAKGKITFSYATQEELEQLLKEWGVDAAG